ncbi:MAG: undecaprenyl-diphosphate phosphatase [candidate division WOR-3 bacterium]
MGWLEGAILGMVQGITEILPISSDGHLAVLQYIWQLPESSRLNLTAALHLGTALAILLFLIGRLKKIGKGIFAPDPSARSRNLQLVFFVILASIPAVIAGILLENKVERVFENIYLVGTFFLVNGTFVFLTRFPGKQKGKIDLKTALLIGLIQVAAIMPAISRSGMTIGLGLILGLTSEEAFDFSFLLALPITLGAAVYELIKVDFSILPSGPVILGIIVATCTGFLMMILLKKLVLSRGFYWFGVYCWVAGLAVLIFLR